MNEFKAYLKIYRGDPKTVRPMVTAVQNNRYLKARDIEYIELIINERLYKVFVDINAGKSTITGEQI